MALTNKLSAIGDAIREKTGKTELLTLDAMPLEIASITTGGGGGDIEVEPIVLTGDCQYSCSGAMASKYIELFGDTVSTEDIVKSAYMFYQYKNETIPFEINYDPSRASHDLRNMFASADYLTILPKINNVKPDFLASLFAFCDSLREIPEDYFDNWNWSFHQKNTSAYQGGHNGLFERCYSLRKLPLGFLKNVSQKPNYSYSYFYMGFNQCYVLDELIDLPIPYISPGWTSNTFNNTFGYCARLKDVIFETNEDGTPKVVQWKSQTIGLTLDNSLYNTKNTILGFNSGITADKEVVDDATYQALKNDPDWFSIKKDYARYNHDSAVRTINSLPDTSAYLATAGGTNTIKFKGDAGAKTDGGAINTLTEEEIAVATAKGWTVSFV